MKVKTKRKLFQQAWQYKEGFLISILLIFFGFITDYLYNDSIRFPGFPTNLSVIITFTLLIAALYKFERNRQIIQWLSSIPAAVTSTVLFAFLSTLLGFFSQIPPGMEVEKGFLYRIGISHLTSSWVFAFGLVYFSVALGFATVKMFMPLKKGKFGVMLSHVGLYIIILTGVAGSGDNLRAYFLLDNKSVPTDKVRDFNSKTYYRTPFQLKLKSFKIQEYNPKIVLVDNQTDSIILPEGTEHFVIEEGDSAFFINKKIKIIQFIKNAFPTDTLYSNFVEWHDYPSLPAAFAEVYEAGRLVSSGWITSGNFALPRKSLSVNNNYFFAMLSPEPKEYSSEVIAYLPDGSTEEFILKVNSPKSIKGWKLYQTGYNEKMGKWSDYSIIEAGHDPWLPFVYTGIFLLIFGALYLFWLGGRTIKDKNEKTQQDTI